MRTKLPSIALIACMITAFSLQSSYGQYDSDGFVSIPSPQVWSFMKYGDTPVDLHTGIAQTEIPIYTYEDYDFSLPISVGYASGGYMPNIQTGILGLGWFLNAGGCVTREIRGLPDEKNVSQNNTAYKGYLAYHNSPPAGTNPPNWSSILDSNAGAARSPAVFSLASNIETTPDIFHFKFPGHSGSFILGPNKTVHVFNTNHPQGEYKVLVNSFTGPERIEIQITTGDGFVYKFGGYDQRQLDNYPYVSNLNYNMPVCNYNLSWMLTTITAPNGRKITFEYFTPALFDVFRPQAYEKRDSYSTGGTGWLSGYEINSWSTSSYKILLGKQYGTKLKNIDIDGKLTISFTYKTKTQEKGKRHDVLGPEPILNLGVIDQIIVKNKQNSQTIRECTFGYRINNAAGGNPITFLKSVRIAGYGAYTLSYYNETDLFPYHGTSAIDHWGFYNKKDSYDPYDLIPKARADERMNEIITSNQREPSFEGSQMGMLEIIEYPTKGCTVFEYEQNAYSRKLCRNYDMSGIPTIKNANIGGYLYSGYKNYPAGGVRIKKITDYASGEDKGTSREFVYTNSGGTDNGILLHYPRYINGFDAETINNGLYYKGGIREMSGESLFSFSMDRYHMEYPSVKEVLSDGAYTIHYFTNYNDTFDDTTRGLVKAVHTRITSPMNADNMYRKMISYHNHRGKPLRQELYDNTGLLLRKHEYTYNKNIKKYSECVDIMWGYYYVHKTLVSEFPLEKEMVTEYFYENGQSNSLSTTKNYLYNALNQVSQITTTSSGGIVERKSFNYLHEQSGWINTNLRAYPWKENIVEVLSNNSERLKSATMYTYTGAPKIISLASIQKAYVDHTSTISNANFYRYHNYDIYNNFGSLLQETDRSGLVTSYVWGHNSLYPVAVVKNADLSTVLKALSWTGTSTFYLSGALSDSQERLLRQIPGAHVYTYKYIPFVGISEETDPAGRKTYYEYDANGKLLKIKDDKNQPVQEYYYQYKNYRNWVPKNN